MELVAKEKRGYKKTEVGIIPSDWKVLELGELLKLKNGYSFSSNYFSKKGPIVLTPGNFNLGGGLYFNERNTKHFSGTFPKEYKFEQGDLLVVMTDLTPDCNLLGKPAFVTESNLLHNQRIGKLIVDEKRVSKNYLYWLMLSSKYAKWMKETAVGSTVRHTSPTNIYKSTVSLPPTLEEQQAIATALNDTDVMIARQEKLISKKKAIKQGAMQQLLTPPQKGGKRLPGFSGEWETKTIRELFNISAGGDLDWNNFSKKKEGDFKFPVYANSLKNEGIYGYTRFPKYPKNCITVTARGSLGHAEYRTGEFEAIVRLLVLMPKESIAGIYFREYINNYVEFAYESTGVPQLTAPQISNYEIVYPNDTEEQKAISSILSDMDIEIAALESKKAKYEGVKQGMMQELLTGKTRLV